MLKDAFQKLVGQKDAVKSYDLVRLQAKTYRLTKYYFADLLKKQDLSTLDWSLMGLLNDSETGLRFSAIAKDMGVEPPFVTELVSKLEKKKLVSIKDSQQDKRAKEVILTKKGQTKIDVLEKTLDEQIVTFFNSISSNELQTYRQVMKKIEATFEAA